MARLGGFRRLRPMTLQITPTNILLIKSHSMGIGDLLRSSAAWVALKRKWPQAKLHLLMLSKHAGYPSEDFISAHELLDSASFVTVKAGHPGMSGQTGLSLRKIFNAVDDQLKAQPIDLVIDCEPYGVKTSLIAHRIGQQKKALTVGIAQFPLRKYFYDISAPSLPDYIKSNNLALPLDYTERDFVALAPLGVARQGARISMQVGSQGKQWQHAHPVHKTAESHKIVTLNIGCGTTDALNKRPDIATLASCMAALYEKKRFTLWLSGASFEQDINASFAEALGRELIKKNLHCEVVDWSGQCTLNELMGLLAFSDLVITTDSGPYHMAVALGLATLCWFNFETIPSLHHQNNVTNLILPTPTEFTAAALRLLHA